MACAARRVTHGFRPSGHAGPGPARTRPWEGEASPQKVSSVHPWADARQVPLQAPQRPGVPLALAAEGAGGERQGPRRQAAGDADSAGGARPSRGPERPRGAAAWAEAVRRPAARLARFARSPAPWGKGQEGGARIPPGARRVAVGSAKPTQRSWARHRQGATQTPRRHKRASQCNHPSEPRTLPPLRPGQPLDPSASPRGADPRQSKCSARPSVRTSGFGPSMGQGRRATQHRRPPGQQVSPDRGPCLRGGAPLGMHPGTNAQSHRRVAVARGHTSQIAAVRSRGRWHGRLQDHGKARVVTPPGQAQ